MIVNYSRLAEIPKSPGVYKITCQSSGRFYIGSSKSIRSRLQKHLRDLMSGIHPNGIMQRSFDKYGKASFVFQVLELMEPELCLSMEQFYVDTLKPTINIRLQDCHSNLGIKLPHCQKTKRLPSND